MKTTCTKIYSDFPAAHRQHKHDGHCALIHGHNWSFEFVFACAALDANQFVVDFGKLKWLRNWLNKQFDHTLLLNADDPFLEYFTETLQEMRPDCTSPSSLCFADIVIVPNCGAEGLAAWLLEKVNELFTSGEYVTEEERLDFLARKVRVVAVTVFEDSKNSATVEAE